MTRRATAVRYTVRTEKEEQRAIVALFRGVGATVYSMSQYRASHVAVGLPDLYVMHERLGLAWWFECKRYEGLWKNGDGETVAYSPFDRTTWRPKPLAEPQAAFRLLCRACGVRHFTGGLHEAEEALITMRIVERTGNGGLVIAAGRRVA